MKILVADDDPTLREELASLLREDGHAITTAEDGGEALRVVDLEPFEVALLDLKMPKATGLEVLHRLRVVRPETAVVMITGEGTIDTAVEAMKNGAIDFVEKPYDLESLRRTLRSVEDERKAKAAIGSVLGAESKIANVLQEAADRKALLCVAGPKGTPPKGASRVLRIDADGRPPDVFSPSQLFHLNAAIDTFVGAADRPVIFAADLAMLEALHGRADMRLWIHHMSGKVGSKGGTLVLGGLEPSLASEIGDAGASEAQSEGLQGMLESLANPIRRAVVGYVFASGPVAYSSILKKSFVDSSSKLSFHLQKLQSDGLLTKVDAGRYAVTDAGRRAWNIVRALSDQKQPSLLISKT
jgi:FixJ family two-component response regulator